MNSINNPQTCDNYGDYIIMGQKRHVNHLRHPCCGDNEIFPDFGGLYFINPDSDLKKLIDTAFAYIFSIETNHQHLWTTYGFPSQLTLIYAIMEFDEFLGDFVKFPNFG